MVVADVVGVVVTEVVGVVLGVVLGVDVCELVMVEVTVVVGVVRSQLAKLPSPNESMALFSVPAALAQSLAT